MFIKFPPVLLIFKRKLPPPLLFGTPVIFRTLEYQWHFINFQILDQFVGKISLEISCWQNFFGQMVEDKSLYLASNVGYSKIVFACSKRALTLPLSFMEEKCCENGPH